MRVGNLASVRDFLDVEDVLEAYLALADRALPAGAYNVASGRGVRIGDALEAILRLAGVKPRIEVNPERLRPTDQAVGDAKRLREATGWAPRVAFETTLERLVAHWRERLSAS
jgi:nucleoside-diphosphate-sugar epimerase